ncbi:hypothetical protein DFAR_2770005 [Desulfarculales bacterium]
MLGMAVLLDPVTEDLVLSLETAVGPLAVSGCAHAGSANILLQVQQVMTRPAICLLGGLHLDHLALLFRQNTLDFLVNQPQLRVAAGHCIGGKALKDLEEHLRGRLTPLSFGLRLKF